MTCPHLASLNLSKQPDWGPKTPPNSYLRYLSLIHGNQSSWHFAPADRYYVPEFPDLVINVFILIIQGYPQSASMNTM